MTKKLSKFVFIFLFALGAFLGPLSVVRAQNSPDNVPDYTNRLQNCVFAHPTDGTGTFEGCLVSGFYYLVLYPSGWFAYQSGRLFDFFMAYSLDSNSYKGGNGDFVNQGWAIIRDIANVLFIFTLLYIAITHILQAGTSGTKKLLTGLIVAALLINFSLFFSKIIIDGGNILANVFYHNIEVTYDDHPDGTGINTISQALVAKVNPQAILSSDLFTPILAPGQAPGVMSNGYAFFIMLVAAFVNITIGVVFISTFLLFAARVIGLWFLMIFSPIAFASLALPNGGSFFGDFGWKGWISNILKLSFMAPVFLFFLFLLIMFLQIVMSQPILAGNTDTAHRLMGTLIPFIAIVVILRRAKSVAGDMAGEFGKSLTSAVGKLAGGALAVTGTGVGILAGGAAWAGRTAIGGAASERLARGTDQENVRMYNMRAQIASEKAAKATTEEERKQHEADARRARRMASWNASKVKASSYLKEKATFDVRKSTLLQRAGGFANTGIGNLTKESFGDKLKFDLGKAGGTQGKYEKEQAKKRLSTAQLYSKDNPDTKGSDETLEKIKTSANEGIESRDEVLKNIDTYMKEINASKSLSQEDKDEKLNVAKIWRLAAESAIRDEDLAKINKGEVSVDHKDKDGNRTGEVVQIKVVTPDQNKVNAISQREGYARQTDYSNLVNLRLGEEAKKKLLKDIRSGKKPKSIEEEMKEWLKEKEKEEHKDKKEEHGDGKKEEHKEEKHEAPKPAPSAPSGGGGGGGGGGHDAHGH